MRARARTHSPAEPESRLVTIDDGHLTSVPVMVRRSRRARHVRLHVSERGDVIVSVPARFPAASIDPIVRERADWLRDALTRITVAGKASVIDLNRGDPVRLLGRWYPTVVHTGGRSSCALDGDRLHITVRPGGDPYAVLEGWYRHTARAVIGDRIEHHARAYGLHPGTLTIRDQRTRWGSCTHRGDLSFNWRLVLAPDWVLEAIVVHELCHIEELNHSPRFWKLLDERYPRHRDAKRWLDTHGGALRVTRPAILSAPSWQQRGGGGAAAPTSGSDDARDDAAAAERAETRARQGRRRGWRAAATARTISLFE